MVPRKLRPLFILFFFFAFSLLTVVVIYQQTELETLNVARDQADRDRVKLIGERVKKEFQNSSRLKEDPYALHLLAEEVGAKQILLIESNGRLLVDSTREIQKGETVPLSLSLHEASEGKEQVLIFSEKKSDKRFIELLLPLEEGPQTQVIRVLGELRITKNPNAEILLLLIKLFSWVGGSWAIISCALSGPSRYPPEPWRAGRAFWTMPYKMPSVN